MLRIENIKRLQGIREVPFGNDLKPLNASSIDLPYTLTKETNKDSEAWQQLVGGARRHLYIAGIGLTGWKGIPGMREALVATTKSGCEVRILTMDVDNPSFKSMLNPDVATSDAANLSASIAETRIWFQKLIGTRNNSEVRSIKKGSLFQQIIICDDKCFITPYLYTLNTGYSPCLEIRSSPVFRSTVAG
jgi:hypothetical protein